MSGFLRNFAGDENGLTAIEYGLLVAGIALLSVVALMLVGDSIDSVFSTVGDHMSSRIEETAE